METTHVTFVEIVEHSYIYIHTDMQTDKSCDAQEKSNNNQENVFISCLHIFKTYLFYLKYDY